MDWVRQNKTACSWAASALMAFAYVAYSAATGDYVPPDVRAVRGRPEPAAGYERQVSEGERAVSVYQPHLNQTDVYLKSVLRLSPGPRKSLIIAPQFSVAGARVSAPPSVMLHFVSTAERALFADGCKLSIVTDKGQIDGTAWVMPDEVTAQQNDGFFTQQLWSRVSYDEFVAVTESERAKLTVGTVEVSLNGDSLAALRDMRRCVEAGRCQ